MTEVKICGITNLGDALWACRCGVDALGFIFFDRSPRYVSPEDARWIIRKLPKTIAKVGVFVNQEIRAVRKIFEHCGLNFIQLHGDESWEYCNTFPPAILIKAVAPRKESDLTELNPYRVKAFLVDSRDPGGYGGTGRLANWELAAAVRRTYPTILAGGLNTDNVGVAIATVSPEAVDVSSGVEIRPGKKDPAKVKLFMDRVRALDLGKDKRIFRVEPACETGVIESKEGM